MEETKINSANKSSVYMMAAGAIVLGIVFDYLFFEKNFGISVIIFESLAIIITLLLCVRFKQSYRSVVWLLGLILFFAVMPSIRDNMFLTILNVLASAGLVLLATKELLKKHIINFKIPDYITTIIVTPFSVLRRSLQALSFLTTPAQKSSTVVLRRVVVGILIALPFLFIFGALFASADLAFNRLIDSIIIFQIPDEFVGHAFLVFGTFVVALGLFAYIFNIPTQKKSQDTLENDKPEKISADRSIEIKVFLWLIAGLFAVFIIFQIAYLFGGIINISEQDFSYADYARRGFWELLFVSFFSLVILLIIDQYTKSNRSRLTWFRIPGLVLTAEVFIIIISALKRLNLYIDAYGLTAQRLYAAGFIIFLAVIFILLAIKLWREKEERFFAFGTLVSMISFLIILNLLNPDAFIARQNIERFDQTGKIDIHYLGNLSADALPTTLGVYDQLNDPDKEELTRLIDIKKEWLEKQQVHWQTYNISRDRALTELKKTGL